MIRAAGMRVLSIASPVLKCVLPDAPPLDPRFQQDTFAARYGFDDQPTLARRAFDIAQRSIDAYKQAALRCWDHGIILADTKFEWGILMGEPVLINEVCTPNCSRFWPTHAYKLGKDIESMDEHFVQGWIEDADFPPNGTLPAGVVDGITQKYQMLYRELSGMDLDL